MVKCQDILIFRINMVKCQDILIFGENRITCQDILMFRVNVVKCQNILIFRVNMVKCYGILIKMVILLFSICFTRLPGYNFFSCSTKLIMKFQAFIKTKMLEKVFCLNLKILYLTCL